MTTNDEFNETDKDEYLEHLGLTADENGEIDVDDYLEHIGIARRSGRYPWGSGKDPYQRSRGFKAYMDDMKSKGLTESEIAKALTEYVNKGVTEKKDMITVKSTDLRAGTAISTERIFAENSARAQQLKAKGLSNGAIAEAMGLPRSAESTVRGWLKTGDQVKEGSLRATANKLKEEVEAKEFLDVGKGNELWIGVTESRLRSAVAMLKDEGYNLYNLTTPQLGTDKDTKMRVLTKEDKTFQDALKARDEGRVKILAAQSDDGGQTFKSPRALPVNFNSKQLQVRYAEEGGSKMDGVIEVRRGVDELSLGSKRYAQVRIAVDGTHYLKGMAMYADDLPPGVNLRFNTNKTKAEALAKGPLGALKPMKTDKDGNVDPENPFGATTKPRLYVDKNGKEKQSVLNIVNEEGSWDDWSKSLSSQMLSKQPITLASKQLAEAQKARREELDKIKSLTNPVVRQKLLDEYADSADAAAVHLKAAALPRQASRVILPINTMRPNEIYAPDFDDGTRVALVRYPHGGPFEIPSLTVNNKNAMAKRILSNAKDAVGIHHTVAQQLSGADFDGDSVLVLDNTSGRIKSRPPLKQLEGFEPQVQYKIPAGDTSTPRMTKKNTQTEMGKISNLITDMTIKGATDSELARAVKHSMVVIDAEKHGLNYKQSEKDQGIQQLRRDYQAKPNGRAGGASTLISRASSDKRIDKIVPRPAKDGGPVDPKTGRKVFVPAPDREYTRVKKDKNGNPRLDADGNPILETKVKKTKGTAMEFVDDARKLSSGTPMEELYAAHANTMKALANEARKTSYDIQAKGLPRQNKAAKVIYKDEIAAIERKLQIAQRNAPLERRAQVLAKARAKAAIDANPQWDKDDIKKAEYRALADARELTGASKTKIGAIDKETGRSTLSSREWEAIQAGAFSSSKLKEILANSDMDRVRDLATPKSRSSLTEGQLARAKMMQTSGRTMSEIAEQLGIPRSTIVDNLNRG